MDKELKKKYLDALKTLEPLLNNIYEGRSGSSWWSPPGEDWFFTCDMGYVFVFIDDLTRWLEGDECQESKSSTHKNINLLFLPKN